MTPTPQGLPESLGLHSQLLDLDPSETQEWLESIDQVVDHAGQNRARYLLLSILQRARDRRVGVANLRSTDYLNTIAPDAEPTFPGDEHIERRIRAYIRWNAAIMVHRAQRPGIGVGGHISTYASAAALYEVGFNHFFRGHDAPGGGDQIYFQGHASPGIYARAFLEGRLTDSQLDGFRQELSHAGPGGGLPSYPHPRLMPDFWEFPTVSMGLGPINAIYQARFNRYLHNRGIKDTSRPAGLGLPRRRRDGRARVPRRDRRRRPRRARQPHLRRQLQPAAPRRPGPRQRQDHPGAGVVLPRRRLERHQGHLGPRMGPAAGRRHRRRPGQPDEHHPRRRLPDLQGRVRRVRPRALLRPRPPHRRDGRAPDRHRDLGPQTRRTRLSQAVRRLPGRDRAHRPADRHPGQDHQGLDARLPLRGPQLHPPDEEAHPRRPQGLPRPAVPGHPRHRPRRSHAALLPPPRRHQRAGVPARAPPRSRRLPARPQSRQANRSTCPARRRTRSHGAARAGSRSPPRWRSSGCSRT